MLLSHQGERRSQGWQDYSQIIIGDIQHVKSAQQAPQMEKSASGQVH